MSDPSKTFHISEILTVTTGSFVATSGIDGLYRILNYMTGESLMTHQLPRASDECAPSLREQFPDLLAVEVPSWSHIPRDDREGAVFAWVDEMVEQYGETREVEPLAPEDHTSIDALAELAMKAPHMTVIPVIVDDAR